MTTKSRIRKALTALEIRRVELERMVSDDLDRKFLSVSEKVIRTDPETRCQSDTNVFEPDFRSDTAGFSTVTWVS